jgi:hypothetical protein
MMAMENQSAIAISYNPEHHARTKHIERRHFYVRECIERMQLRVPFVSTVDNLADFFTKPLPSKQFFAMRDTLMNVPMHVRHVANCARPPAGEKIPSVAVSAAG